MGSTEYCRRVAGIAVVGALAPLLACSTGPVDPETFDTEPADSGGTACQGCDTGGGVDTDKTDTADTSESRDTGDSRDSADTAAGVETDAPFDECAELRGDPAAEVRLVAEEYHGTEVTDDVVVFSSEDEISDWWAMMGYEGPPPDIDFSTEQAVAFAMSYSQGCGEGKLLDGFSWDLDHSALLAEIFVGEPCLRGCDDKMLFTRIFATPQVSVASCDFGVTCESGD